MQFCIFYLKISVHKFLLYIIWLNRYAIRPSTSLIASSIFLSMQVRPMTKCLDIDSRLLKFAFNGFSLDVTPTLIWIDTLSDMEWGTRSEILRDGWCHVDHEVWFRLLCVDVCLYFGGEGAIIMFRSGCHCFFVSMVVNATLTTNNLPGMLVSEFSEG